MTFPFHPNTYFAEDFIIVDITTQMSIFSMEDLTNRKDLNYYPFQNNLDRRYFSNDAIVYSDKVNGVV